MWSDLQYALRQLAKARGFTALAIVVLSVGIAANAAIFSLIDAALIRPLAYADPDRLVAVHEGLPTAGLSGIPFSAPDYVALERENHVFESVGGFQDASFELSGTDRPQRVPGARITATLFPTVGIKPAIGRGFTQQEDRNGLPV